MNLIISTGSNIGERESYLIEAKNKLASLYKLVEESNIYESPAVDYLNQPDFLNQVLSFELPKQNPSSVMLQLLEIEKEMGRKRDIDKGPRTIDLDILFWGLEALNSPQLTTPHPRLFERSFIVLPLKELAVFPVLAEKFKFPKKFDNSCWVFKSQRKSNVIKLTLILRGTYNVTVLLQEASHVKF